MRQLELWGGHECTVNRVGSGRVYYLAARPSGDSFFDGFTRGLVSQVKVSRCLDAALPEGVHDQSAGDAEFGRLQRRSGTITRRLAGVLVTAAVAKLRDRRSTRTADGPSSPSVSPPTAASRRSVFSERPVSAKHPGSKAECSGGGSEICPPHAILMDRATER